MNDARTAALTLPSRVTAAALGVSALALAHLDRATDPQGLLAVLIAEQRHLDAIRVLALAMPRPLAVRWAVSCVRRALPPSPDALEIECLRAAARWVREPTEADRETARRLAQQAGYASPAAWSAAAAAWSGGSLAEPGDPVLPPPAHLTAHAVAGAIGLVAAQGPEPHPQAARAALRRGLELVREASGGA